MQLPSLRRAVFARWFDSLTVSGYRWLWAGNFLGFYSVVVSRLALGWLVLNLTNSAYWVGVAASMDGLGRLLFGLFGGVWVDRFDKRRVVQAALLAFGLLALALGVLIQLEAVPLSVILVAAFLLGGLDALMLLASNTLIFHLVGPARVMNASALNLLGFNAARMVGSVAAGLIIAQAGQPAAWFMSGGAACLAVWPYLRVRGRFVSSEPRTAFWPALRAGLRHAWQDGAIRQVLGLSVMAELCVFSEFTLIPVMARDVLHVGAEGLGYLTAATSLGAALGTALLAGLSHIGRKGALLWGGVMTGALLLTAFAYSPWYPLSLVLSVGLGFWLAGYDALMQVMIQLLTPDAVRGRIFSLYVLSYGFASLGGYLAGLVASLAGAPLAIGLGGGLIVAYLIGVARPIVGLQPGPGDASGSAGQSGGSA